MRVGVDTGGTFTDAVAADGRVAKVPSSPAEPARAVARAMAGVGGAGVLAHGTTVATNALLQRAGGTVALVTTAGFTDVVEIGRQDRPHLYDPFADRPDPLVGRSLRLEAAGRLDARGREVEPVDPASLPTVPAGVDSVAVCLLHADLDPGHERAVARALRALGHDVSCSHEVSPEFREYERTVATVINAYLRRPCRRYLGALADLADIVEVMTSAGGLVPLEEAAERPAALVLSGPAGGAQAGAVAAAGAGYPDAVTFDMGGTSTDVCLVLGGRPAAAGQRTVAGYPLRLPSLDIHTIGAGGGSIAYLDPGGALRVGPRSAGAEPGPACYGRGGSEPTVTDADLVAGRIPDDAPLAGLGRLDAGAAERALDRAGLDAAGVIAVVDEAMVQAVRAVTVARGVDPRELALVAFGGAGPLHACAVAAALDMAAVVVPAGAGVLSAAGILGASRQVDLVRSWPEPADHRGLEAALATLAAEAVAAAGAGAGASVGVDCRYAGQSHELTVAGVGDFAAEHSRRNGYQRPGAPVEVVALRASARGPAPGPLRPPALPARRPLSGPRVVAEPDCTVWVPPGWSARVHPGGAWILGPGGP